MSRYSKRGENHDDSAHDPNTAHTTGKNEYKDDDSTELFDTTSRRHFVGGLTSLLAASAFSLTVADEAAAQVTGGDASSTQTLTSPDGTVAVTVDITDGVPSYSVAHNGTTVIAESTLGFEFQSQSSFLDGIVVTGTERSQVDETWTPVWDQYDEIREHYEELRVGLQESGGAGRTLTLELRAFNDGIGFRFVFPEDSGFGDFTIRSERTEFAFADDYTSWWIQNDFNSFEYPYKETPLSEISSRSSFGGAHTPITMKAAEDQYLSVHEANLVDYASMAIEPQSAGSTTFESTLAPFPNGMKVTASTPHQTPWRTVQMGERPGDLIESSLIVNLNEPHDPADFPKGINWITPHKFLGVWWLMITGRAQWQYLGPETGNHGAQTGRMKQYMDFASEHEIPSVLVEGWNEGWNSYPGDGSTMDFDDPYPDFAWTEVTNYGLQLNPPVEMTSHNETAGNITNYEKQLDNNPNPFEDYENLGIRSVKTGYVADSGVFIGGTIYNHHCQPMVNHHHLVYRKAAKHRQMLEIHEPIHPTGERRTYPNVMTREGVLGQEYDAFGYIDPSHHVTFPFTRMLGGPVEYTPGIFAMDSGSGGIETTRAKQLAMYPNYFSGLHMVADLPSSYLADQPPVLGVGEVAQAEFARIDGFPTGTKWAGAQGGRYIPVDPNRADTGATVSWTVEGVENAGEYEFHLRYANDAEDNAVPAGVPRTATVRVNGSVSTQVTFPPTAYWDEWETVSTSVSLESGENTVSVTLTEADTGGFNLDSVAVTEPTIVGVGEVIQAESGELDGFFTATKWPNAQGGQYVPIDPNRVESGATVSWSVEQVESAGEYDIHFRYANDEERNALPPDVPRTATVTVNGSASTQITVPPTEFWNVWRTISTTVALDAGQNTVSVTLAKDDTGGFNLDSVAATETGQPMPKPALTETSQSMPEPETDPILGPTVDEFEFVKDVPAAGWDDTCVLDSAIGKYMVTARKKDGEWYVGAMTDENGRALNVPLDFLARGKPGLPDEDEEEEEEEGDGKEEGEDHEEGEDEEGDEEDDEVVEDDDDKNDQKYVAEIYTDGIDATYDENLAAVRVNAAIVDSNTTVLASMIKSGGTVIRLRPATGSDIADLPTYERPSQDIDVTIENETFVQEPFITATGSNDSDYIGGTTVELVVGGEVVANANIRFPPNTTSGSYTFSYAISDPGTYNVTVQTTDGTTLASKIVRVKPPATVATFADPAGDDHGPGSYTYPTADAFEAGAFDLRSFTVAQTPSIYQFTFEVANLYNAFGSRQGFSPHMFVLWVRDPAESGGSTTSLDDLLATTAFEKPWHYRLEVSGFTKSAVDANGTPLTDTEGNAITPRETVDTSAGTVTLSLDRAAFGGVDAANLEVVPMVQSENFGTLRPVKVQNDGYVFGGAKPGAVDMAPRIMDVITPEGVTQSDALAYTADQLASLPFVPIE